jgi:hypothetical protein
VDPLFQIRPNNCLGADELHSLYDSEEKRAVNLERICCLILLEDRQSALAARRPDHMTITLPSFSFATGLSEDRDQMFSGMTKTLTPLCHRISIRM